MKKTLNEDQIQNELREGSAFFRRPELADPTSPAAAPNSELDDGGARDPQPAPLPPDAPARESSQGVQPVRPYASPDARPSGRLTAHRVIRRHPFEFYQDQLEALKRLSLEEQLAGGNGSMSEMVREAVDRYLHQRGREERLRQERASSVRATSRTGGRASD